MRRKAEKLLQGLLSKVENMDKAYAAKVADLIPPEQGMSRALLGSALTDVEVPAGLPSDLNRQAQMMKAGVLTSNIGARYVAPTIGAIGLERALSSIYGAAFPDDQSNQLPGQ